MEASHMADQQPGGEKGYSREKVRKSKLTVETQSVKESKLGREIQ